VSNRVPSRLSVGIGIPKCWMPIDTSSGDGGDIANEGDLSRRVLPALEAGCSVIRE